MTDARLCRTAARCGLLGPRRGWQRLLMPVVLVMAMVLLVGACGASESEPSVPSATAAAAAPAAETTTAPEASTAADVDTPDAGMSPDVQTIVSGLSAAVGGLSDASHQCVAALLSEDPSLAEALLAAGGPVEGPETLQILVCLTADEAAALTPPGDGAAPDPSEIACLMDALSGEPSGERILAVISGADLSGEGLSVDESAILGEAVAFCGIETEFGFGDPSAAGGSLPDDDYSGGGSWGACTEWLIMYPGDVCDLGELIVTVEGDGTVRLDGSIGGDAVDGMRFDGDVVDAHGLLMAYDGAAWTINALPQ